MPSFIQSGAPIKLDGQDWLKTLRKTNASVIFATQQLADIDRSAIKAAIIGSRPRRSLLRYEHALEPQIAPIHQRFGPQ